MKILKMAGIVVLFVSTAIAQESKAAAEDVLHTVQALKPVAMFDIALRSSGWATELRGQGPFTVIAPGNNAFANLSKDDMQKLMTSPAALNFLIAHYIVHGDISSSNVAQLSSAKTLIGVRLRADRHNGDLIVNGARIVNGDIHCTNGVIHIVDQLDPGLVHEALAMVTVPERARKQ